MHTQLRKVEIEDLLPREKIEIDMEAVGRLLRGQRILITGAAGSIGGEMVRQIASIRSGSFDLGRSSGDSLARHPLDDGEGLAGYQRLYLGGGHR